VGLSGASVARALYTRSSHVYVGHGRTVTGNKLEGEVWCRLDDEVVAWRQALFTPSSLFYVGVGGLAWIRGSRALLLCNMAKGPLHIGDGNRWLRVGSCRPHKGASVGD
jgi:hypothetical protein